LAISSRKWGRLDLVDYFRCFAFFLPCTYGIQLYTSDTFRGRSSSICPTTLTQRERLEERIRQSLAPTGDPGRDEDISCLHPCYSTSLLEGIKISPIHLPIDSRYTRFGSNSRLHQPTTIPRRRLRWHQSSLGRRWSRLCLRWRWCLADLRRRHERHRGILSRAR
jgi:hypothetical protein